MKFCIESIQKKRKKKKEIWNKQQTINTLIKYKVTLLTDFQKSILPHTKISNCKLMLVFFIMACPVETLFVLSEMLHLFSI